MSRGRKAKGKRSAVVAVYLTPKLLERLRDVAATERRTASTQALLYIERCLEQDAR